MDQDIDRLEFEKRQLAAAIYAERDRHFRALQPILQEIQRIVAQGLGVPALNSSMRELVQEEDRRHTEAMRQLLHQRDALNRCWMEDGQMRVPLLVPGENAE